MPRSIVASWPSDDAAGATTARRPWHRAVLLVIAAALQVVAACTGEGALSTPTSVDSGIMLAPDGSPAPFPPGGDDDGGATSDGSSSDGGLVNDSAPPPFDSSLPPGHRICDVRSYVARGLGDASDQREAIQKAADDCADGGQIFFSGAAGAPSSYTTSSFVVHGVNVELTIDNGVTVNAVIPPDLVDAGGTLSPTPLFDDEFPLITCDYGAPDCASNPYPPWLTRRAFVQVRNVTGFVLDGYGTLDAHGAEDVWEGRHYGVSALPASARPHALDIVRSTNVKVKNVTVKNAAYWSVVLQEDDHVLVDGFTVSSAGNSNQDGIDVYDTSNIVIQNTSVSSSDDGICFKSSDPTLGVADASVVDSSVTGVANDTQNLSGGNGLKFGTATRGQLTNVTFSHLVVRNYGEAAIALESTEGAHVSQIHYDHIQYDNVGAPIYVLLAFDDAGVNGEPDADFGSIDGVSFDTIAPVAGGTMYKNWGSTLSGSCVYDADGGPVKLLSLGSITMHEVTLTSLPRTGSVPAEPMEFVRTLPAGKPGYPDPTDWGTLPSYGLFMRHVNMSTPVDLEGVTYTASSGDTRPATVLYDGKCTGSGCNVASEDAGHCPASM